MKKSFLVCLMATFLSLCGHSQTDCQDQFLSSSDLPFLIDFEGEVADQKPQCWTVLDSVASGSTIYPAVKYSTTTSYTTSQAYSGTNYLYLYKSNTIAMYAYSGDISQLQITFHSKANNSFTGDYLEIGIMTDLSNDSSYTPIDTIQSTDYTMGAISPLYMESIVKFDSYTTNDAITKYYIVFKSVLNSSYNTWYIDDITVDIIPDCEKAKNLTIDSLGVNSVNLSWTQTGDNFSWTVYYKRVIDDTLAYTQVNTSTPSLTLTGLDAQTEYKLFVKTNCGENPASSDIITFKTLCDVMVVDDQNAWVEDFSDDAYCWSLPKTNNYNWEAYSNNSIRTYIYKNTEAISPVLDISNVSTPFVKVSYTSNTTMELYYRSADSNDWVFFAELTPASDMITDSAALPNPSSSYQIKILSYGNNVYGFNYVYNVTVSNVENPPLCSKPQKVLTSTTSSTATITWTQLDATTTWVVYYKESTSTTYTSSEELTENTYTFSTSPNTSYDAYVAAVCGDNEGDYPTSSVVTFTTPCEGIMASDLPKVWDFETDNVDMYSSSSATYSLPECWTHIGSYYNTYVISNTTWGTYSYSGTKALTLSSNALAILTPIDTTLNVSNLQLSFYAKSMYSSSTSTVTIGVMTDPTDSTTFVPTTTITTTSTYELYEVPLLYSGTETALYIALRGTSNLVLDSLILNNAPTCTKPSNLSITGLNANGCTLTWDQTGATSQWRIFYKQENSEQYDSTEVVTEKSYTFTNLVSDNTYTFYVKALCSETESNDSKTTSIYIPCQPITTADLPYTTDFEEFNDSSTPTCWTITKKADNSTTYPTVKNSSYNSNSGTNYLEMYKECAITVRSFSGDVSALQLSFSAKPSSTSTYGGKLVVGVMTDLSDLSTFTVVDTFSATSWATNNGYQTLDVSFSSYTMDENITTYYIALQTVNSSYYYWRIDDVTLSEKPACEKATEVTFTNITSSSATVSWSQEDDSDSWTVYYKKNTDSVYSQINATGTPTAELTGLDPITKYDVYIVTLCGDKSPSTNVFSFNTICPEDNLTLTEEISYIEDFEIYSAGETPACWTVVKNDAAYPLGIKVETSAYTDYAYTGLNGFVMYASTACPKSVVALREFDNDLTDLRVQFYYRSQSTTAGTLELGYITDVTNAETFVPLSNIEANKEWTLFTVDLAAFSDELTNVEDARLALRQNTYTTSSYYYFLIDSLSVSLSPTCTMPTNIDITSTKDTTTITWYSSAMAYNITITDTLGTAVVSQTNYTTTKFSTSELDYNTTYILNLTGICSDSTNTETTTQYFTTPCGLLTSADLPKTWDFENDTYVIDYYNYPSCWTMNTTYPYVTYSENSHRLYFYSYGGSMYASLPEIDTEDLAINTLQITFDATQSTYQTTTSTLYVGIMTDPLDTATFTSVQSIDISNDSISHTISFASYTGEGTYITFHVSNQSAYIDNVVLMQTTIDTVTPPAEPCNAPTSLTANNVAQTSAIITWIGTATSYNVQVNDNEIETTTDIMKQLLDLTPSTTYTVKVRSICEDTASDWVTTTFTTLEDVQPEPCDKPTDLNVTSTTTSLTLTWNGTATSYDVQLNDETIQTTSQTTYTFTGLTPKTTYTLKVRSNCGETTSDWATTTATTADSSSLIDINNLVSVVTYPNPTTTDATLEVKGLTEDANVVVMDVNGKVVYRTVYSANQSSIKISTENLSAGVYYIKVTNSSMTKTQTLIKQ